MASYTGGFTPDALQQSPSPQWQMSGVGRPVAGAQAHAQVKAADAAADADAETGVTAIAHHHRPTHALQGLCAEVHAVHPVAQVAVGAQTAAVGVERVVRVARAARRCECVDVVFGGGA